MLRCLFFVVYFSCLSWFSLFGCGGRPRWLFRGSLFLARCRGTALESYSWRVLTTAFRGLLAGFVVLALAGRGVAADEPTDKPALRWGGDQEGGGPYIYPRD